MKLRTVGIADLFIRANLKLWVVHQPLPRAASCVYFRRTLGSSSYQTGLRS